MPLPPPLPPESAGSAGLHAPRVVDRLAEMTAFRDRERLDTTLVHSFMDLLQPLRVVVWRTVGSEDDQRWLTRARLSRGEAVCSGDPPWTEFEALPRLADDAALAAALIEGRPAFLGGVPHRSLFPLATELEIVGVMELLSDAPLDAAQRQIVASMLRVFRNFEALLDDSERDTLTGLLNRKTFDASFLKIAAGAAVPAGDGERREADGPETADHWLGVIDIDHFKKVNDNHGHLIGDEVLLLLARLMRNTFRHEDRLYRFGGEEFVVLMRCPGAERAALAFERLRLAAERHVFPQVGHISVSIGFTKLVPPETPSGAFERADRAVYYAKAHGRNQVRDFGLLVAQGELEGAAPKVGDVELF
jgi:diguanylate cyclase (GGDEF)-like protein